MADWIINDSNGKADVVMVNIEDYPILQAERKAIQAEFEQKCSGCKFDLLPVTVDDVGAARCRRRSPRTCSHIRTSTTLSSRSPTSASGSPRHCSRRHEGQGQDHRRPEQHGRPQGDRQGRDRGVDQSGAGVRGLAEPRRAGADRQEQAADRSTRSPAGSRAGWSTRPPRHRRSSTARGEWPGPEGYQEKFKQLWGGSGAVDRPIAGAHPGAGRRHHHLPFQEELCQTEPRSPALARRGRSARTARMYRPGGLAVLVPARHRALGRDPRGGLRRGGRSPPRRRDHRPAPMRATASMGSAPKYFRVAMARIAGRGLRRAVVHRVDGDTVTARTYLFARSGSVPRSWGIRLRRSAWPSATRRAGVLRPRAVASSQRHRRRHGVAAQLVGD